MNFFVSLAENIRTKKEYNNKENETNGHAK